jgi:hypothetical protein
MAASPVAPLVLSLQAPSRTPIQADLFDAVLSTFGPFAIAAAIFALGSVGYFSLLALRRLWERRG